MSDNYEIAFVPGTNPDEILHWEHGYRTTVSDGMHIEWDAGVPMRDGTRIFIDIFKPAETGPVPTIIAWGPYGKQSPRGVYQRFGNNGDVKPEWYSKYAIFEAPDPLYWTQHGYAVIHADPRGLWNSEGNATFWSDTEALDIYDLIEWIARQTWSNGKVGMAGVSYLTTVQWQVAALNPPHLAAINPWEGYSDCYRRQFHGGIPENVFVSRWTSNMRWSRGQVEDFMEMRRRHPFFDSYWQSKAPALQKITVPAFVVASWSDQGLHTQGTLESFREISSPQKWLLVHGRKKWETYMRPDMVEKQRSFFDHFLLGKPSDLLSWPPIMLEVRERYYVGEDRAEQEWPLNRTNYTKLFLDATTKSLSNEPPQRAGVTSYDALEGSAAFEHRFDVDTEITGYAKLRLWVSTSGGNDLDLFIAIYKLDVDGSRVPLAFFSVFEKGPVALGWLRVSHREVDKEKSTPYQPRLLHQRELPIAPGEKVPVDIEVWPSSMLYRAGETLQLIIQGRDFEYGDPSIGPIQGHGPLRNVGEHTIYSGGAFDSHLLIPVIPDKS